VSEGNRLVDLVVDHGASVAEASRLVGVWRKSAYKWLSRFREGRCGALADRRRARLAGAFWTAPMRPSASSRCGHRAHDSPRTNVQFSPPAVDADRRAAPECVWPLWLRHSSVRQSKLLLRGVQDRVV